MTTNHDDGQPATTAGPCDDATVIVPPPTEAAPELAWSHEEPATEPLPQSWGSVWGIAGIVLACAAVAAFVIGIVGWANERSDDLPPIPDTAALAPATMPALALPPASSAPIAAPAPSTVTVTPAPPATVTVQAAPPSRVAPPPRDADQIFRQGVSGVPGLTIVNWDVAEAGARSICGGFARGMTRAQIIDEVQRNDPTFTPWQTSGLVNVALAAYCPQYAG